MHAEEMKSKSSASMWAIPTLFVLTYFGARAVVEMRDLAAATRVAATLVPIAVFAWWLFAMARGIRKSDELERRIQLEALAFAFPLSILLMFALGLLELAVELPPQDLSYRHVWMFLCVFYFAGLAIARRRYQ
jgi:small-conductance mechanosensitive channel